jgi:hypothetical protein
MSCGAELRVASGLPERNNARAPTAKTGLASKSCRIASGVCPTGRRVPGGSLPNSWEHRSVHDFFPRQLPRNLGGQTALVSGCGRSTVRGTQESPNEGRELGCRRKREPCSRSEVPSVSPGAIAKPRRLLAMLDQWFRENRIDIPWRLALPGDPPSDWREFAGRVRPAMTCLQPGAPKGPRAEPGPRRLRLGLAFVADEAHELILNVLGHLRLRPVPTDYDSDN